MSHFQCKPCGGIFLGGACRAIAVADFLATVFAMVFNVVGSIQASKELPNDPFYNEMSMAERKIIYKKWLIILTTSYFVAYIVFMAMAAVLFIGAVERCEKKCRVYIYVWLFLITVNTCLLAIHEVKITASHFVCVAFACFHAYKIYSLWVVYCFVKEIHSMGDYNDLLRNLNDEEIKDFEQGNPNCPFSPYLENNGEIGAKPFSREYQIAPEQLLLEEDAILGSGAYGMVLKGKLIQPNGDHLEVAVKTTKPDAAGVAYFKALLLELKIMAFVGPHVNIVTLHGAITNHIRSRQLWIVVELCANGSLEVFLRNNRDNFRDYVHNDVIKNLALEDDDNNTVISVPVNDYNNMHEITTEDLLNWSVHIAKGMMYLADKRVIHGDLACRNILVMADKTVKITDFGLSRKMYNYAAYVTKESAPLPWRYMAVESLKYLRFSTMSDVWSYGVTLWEMFTLGSVPFSGLTWTSEFGDLLENGLRLKKPQYATSELYKIMMDCWHNDPDFRPNFETLKDYFSDILSQLNPMVQEKYCYYSG